MLLSLKIKMPYIRSRMDIAHEKKRAVIIGAGPAGLTAAYELILRSDIVPVLVEADPEYVGGIARTVNYKGNRIDIGGHRFFSKSDRVMDWWMNIMPVEAGEGEKLEIRYHGKSREFINSSQVSDPDRVMLVRNRKSRIYYNKTFFEYPVRLDLDTIRKLGLKKMIRIGFSYLRSTIFPIKNESNLEEFFINRFGKELYLTFFKDYTEKVWGQKCSEISAEWGAQRIKGLDLMAAVAHFVRSLFRKKKTDIQQKDKETSLIERFLYPRLGPGQLWELVRDIVLEKGGEIHMGHSCRKVFSSGSRITGIETVDEAGNAHVFEGDYFFSTMPVRDLIHAWQSPVPERIREVAGGLLYRDYFTVGLLVKGLKIRDKHPASGPLIRDNWIYVQEPGVEIGRLQIFNNWSPFMVKDPATVWLGLEYFCQESDEIWKRGNDSLIELGKNELIKIGILEEGVVLDACVIRMPKTYPAYFGTYASFGEVRDFLDSYDNLFPVGRNGMHKYNNQDHSMLTAISAVDNILSGRKDKSNIWAVNTEEEYHEEK
jgi:protoporphyrinogen oxidase